MGINIAARIRAVGEPTSRTAKKGAVECKVKCQGCGEDITSDGILATMGGVEYVKTKRGSEWFFHTECMDKIWGRKIV